MMMGKVVLGWMAMVAVTAVVAAPAAATTPAVKNNFPRPPAAAISSLHRTVGKPFNAGYVFIDGHYIKPPYTVERYGTVIRINNCQVTSEIVPWEEFIKTQEGVTVTKSETPAAGGGAAGGGDAVDDLFADDTASAPEPEPEPEVEEEEEEEDDSASSLDDLFDDDPKPKKTTAKKKPAKKKVVKPKVRKPTATVSYSFDGEFKPNEKSKALVTKVNAMRTRIDSMLRAGGNYFFSARYSNVSGDARTSKLIMDKLPGLLKNSPDRDAFAAGCRQVGLSAFPASLLDDLYRNRFDYLQLMERRKEEQQKNQWQSLLGE